MIRENKNLSAKAGLPPGALVHVGEKRTDKVGLELFLYNGEGFKEKRFQTIDECLSMAKSPSEIMWLNLEGIHDVDVIERIGKHLNLHPLLLEDILNTHQRPKTDDYTDYLFFVMKMLHYNKKSNDIRIEQVSLILGKDYVISFQEGLKGDVFNPIRERIRNNKSRIRNMGADYLVYSLVDAIVDSYFVIVEKIGDRIEELEEEMITRPGPHTLQSIHRMKRNLLFLRKSTWPLREVLSGLNEGASPLIGSTLGAYFRDVYDHTFQVIDIVESFQEMLSGMIDVYLSSISNRMNEVMKVLTLISTIFMPLTFIAGIYGMNFQYMPELRWQYGYWAVLFLMAVISLVMVYYFKRKKWL